MKVLVRRYNPITMKPATLEPYIPLHLPLIWGPDPSAGSSYGCYQNDQKTMVVSKKQESVYCPITGKKMKFIGDVDAIEFEKSSADIKKHSTCSNCDSEIFSNFEVSDEFNCWNCGHKLKGEIKTMSKIKEIRKSIEAKISIAEEGEFVSIDKLLTELEKGKETEEKSEKLVPATEEKPEESEEPVEAAKEVPEEKKEEETESKDEESESKEETEPKKEEVSEESGVSEQVSDEIEEKVADEVSEQVSEEIEDQVSDEVSEQVSEEIEDNIEDIAEEVSEQVSEEVKEHIEDTIKDMNESNEEDEEKETEDMIDLDIVLSMAKARKEDMVDLRTVISMVEEKSRREQAFKSAKAKIENKTKGEETMKTEKEKTIARLRAKARANILKKRVEAEIEVEPAVMVEVVAPAIEEKAAEEFEILEVPASDVPCAPAAEELSMSPEALEEHVEAPAEESEALRYETLSSLDDVRSYGKEDVELVLFNERTNNPTWMVFCKASPLAKVECAKQADADAIREVFASESFATDFVNHCADIGLIESLQNVNATFFANETSDKKIEARFEAKAEAKIAKFKAQAEAKLRTDLMRALDVVTVGMTKNLYSDVGHPLKDALFEGMTLAGLPENTAASVVNASFATSAAAYYQVVFEKAIAFMNMNETAQSELKQMISDASVISHEVNDNDMNLNERLSRASSVASLRPYDVSVRPSIEIDRDSYKARLKATMKK